MQADGDKPAPALIGGSAGHPAPTPSPPFVPTLATTPKSATKMEDMLGELASRYRVSPETIEKLQLDFLNYFLEDMASTRMADTM